MAVVDHMHSSGRAWGGGVMTMVQEVPHRLSRVTVDHAVSDRAGIPVARLRGESHPATREATAFVAGRCRQ